MRRSHRPHVSEAALPEPGTLRTIRTVSFARAARRLAVAVAGTTGLHETRDTRAIRRFAVADGRGGPVRPDPDARARDRALAGNGSRCPRHARERRWNVARPAERPAPRHALGPCPRSVPRDTW